MPIELEHASTMKIVGAILAASIVVGALTAVLLKFVAESVLKHPVTLVDSFKAAFAATFFVAGAVMILVVTKLVSPATTGGIALQAVGLIFSVVVLAFTTALFVRGPEGERPEFAQAGVAAAIVQVILLLVQIALSASGAPPAN